MKIVVISYWTKHSFIIGGFNLFILILIFQSHPIQYFSPLYQEMAKSIEMEVVYYSDTSLQPSFDKGFGQTIQWDIPLLEGYQYSILKNFSHSKSMDCKWYNAINFSVFKKIKNSTANVLLINGWSYFTDWLVILSAKMYGKEVWVRADNPLSQEQRKGLKAILKQLIFSKLLFPLIAKFLYVGKDSKAYFEFYGIKKHQLIYTPHAVDNARFQKEHYELKSSREYFKYNLDIAVNNKIVLWTGKLISKKRPYDMLKAFQQLNVPNIELLLIGDGYLRPALEEYVRRNAINNVHFIGFVNQSNISQYYAIADVFVMTSGKGETWGLAVNEAINFNLPIIVSDSCGCASDLLEDTINGYVYPVGNIQQLTGNIRHVLAGNMDVNNLKHKNTEVLKEFSYATISENISISLC